jgi:hypothetical protein
MKEETKLRTTGDAKAEELPVIEGELIEDSAANVDLSEIKAQTPKTKVVESQTKAVNQTQNSQRAALNYVFLPLIFLTVTLLGGLRLSADINAFIFLKPALVCLIFAAILLVLFFRAQLLRIEGWFSEDFSTVKNAANGAVLLTLFTASVQIFNALLPERGLPFWVIALLFFWTLWNNLFSVFTAKRLLQSLGSMFGLAFVLKYLILANLTAPERSSWIQGIVENPAKEAFTYLLDLPKFSAGTGYIQFFTVVFYVLGLFLLSPVSTSEAGNKIAKIGDD